MRRKRIPQSLRIAVWNKHIGRVYEGKCYVGCGEIITPFNFECGHIISHKENGRIELDNLVPICSTCNKSIGTKNVHTFIKEHGMKNKKIKKKIKKKIDEDEYQILSGSKEEIIKYIKKELKQRVQDNKIRTDEKLLSEIYYFMSEKYNKYIDKEEKYNYSYDRLIRNKRIYCKKEFIERIIKK